MNKIKVTHINPTDTKGGASLAGYRVHKDLLNYPEVDSINFVDERYTHDTEVVKFSNYFLRQFERVLNKLGYYTGLQYWFSINWLPLLFKKRFWETDVFIIRNIHGGLLPFWLPWLLSKFAPVIWRLPDMWAFTGHCVYSYECDKWKTNCHRCPLLRDYPALAIDTTSLLFKIKRYVYGKLRLHIVAPSTWMMNNVLHSPILNKFDHYYIPPGVDTEIFKPGTHKLTKPTLVFVSGSLKDKRKGALVIPSILEKLDQALESRGLHVDIKWIGERDIELPSYRNVHNIYLGSLAQDDISIQYASSYIHILPTLADNLPNTILESMACGTPVVAFDIGGCKDVVISHKTGYLAKPGDVDDFVAGIMSLLDNQSQYQEISNNCRLFIKENFNLKIQTIRYVDLIKKICMVDSGQKG